MKYLGAIRVIPSIPPEMARLKDLAYNLYFSWNPEVRDLFLEIDRELWKEVNHNPVKFLNEVAQTKLQEKARDSEFLKTYRKVVDQFDRYLKEQRTWFKENFPEYTNRKIAYFTAEFGFHESLPIYAGGLGVLAGDHLKTASDLGLPLVGVSLFYYQTYFTQEIDVHGNQLAIYDPLTPEELPLLLVRNSDGTPLIIDIPVADRTVKAQIWEVKVGRVAAFLLDTNIAANTPDDRKITSRLYGGDQEMRISQEIVLGMGGVIALKKMGINPDIWHMNEGHSVFLVLERLRSLIKEQGLNFNEALEAVASRTIFTTHTPVPAGNDAFPLHIKDKYFRKYWESVGIRRHQFMELGSQVQPEGYEIFNLTILSLNLSRFRNAVSKLHGEVSRKLWKTVWPDIPAYEVPITHITNGVHAQSWVSRRMRALYSQYLTNAWVQKQDDVNFWTKIDHISDEAIWETKLKLKERMLNHVKERLEKQYFRNKVGSLQTIRIRQLLRPEVLTIGFARRFAAYKRGTLILRNLERLKRILNNPERPVQLIYAGKAHPKDKAGQELIRQIYQISLTPEFRGKIVFVENYDMGLARDLISGVDVWLNNPIRTQEASGTSGQKASLNGVINFSVLDGWWVEGYNRKNGWAFGDREDFESQEELDSWDSEQLYDILENDIIPLYYQRDEKGLPSAWIQVMRESIKSVMPQFNTNRMIKQYWQKLYLPAIQFGELYSRNDFAVAKEIAAWREKIEYNWSEVQIKCCKIHSNSGKNVTVKFGKELTIEAQIHIGKLSPTDVKVQVFLAKFRDHEQVQEKIEVFDLQLMESLGNGDYSYRASVQPSDSGNYHYTVRVLPYHEHLINPVELGLACWAEGTVCE